MLQQPNPEDFVLATGETHTVREFATEAFAELNMELEWTGEGIEEKGIRKSDGKIVVEVDPRYFRPTEVELLVGNPAKAKEKLGWEAKTKFIELAHLMARADYDKVKRRGY